MLITFFRPEFSFPVPLWLGTSWVLPFGEKWRLQITDYRCRIRDTTVPSLENLLSHECQAFSGKIFGVFICCFSEKKEKHPSKSVCSRLDLRPFPPKAIPTKMLTFQPPNLSFYSSNNSFSLTMSSSSFTISFRTSKSSSINSDTSSRTPAIFFCLREEWNDTGCGRDPSVPTKFSNLGQHDGDVVVFIVHHSLWLVFIAFVFNFDIMIFTDAPVEIGCRFIIIVIISQYKTLECCPHYE